MSVKYMAGNRCASNCPCGVMEAMGTSRPEYRTEGMMVRITVSSIAATWVRTMSEASRPMPVVQVT